MRNESMRLARFLAAMMTLSLSLLAAPPVKLEFSWQANRLPILAGEDYSYVEDQSVAWSFVLRIENVAAHKVAIRSYHVQAFDVSGQQIRAHLEPESEFTRRQDKFVLAPGEHRVVKLDPMAARCNPSFTEAGQARLDAVVVVRYEQAGKWVSEEVRASSPVQVHDLADYVVERKIAYVEEARNGFRYTYGASTIRVDESHRLYTWWTSAPPDGQEDLHVDFLTTLKGPTTFVIAPLQVGVFGDDQPKSGHLPVHRIAYIDEPGALKVISCPVTLSAPVKLDTFTTQAPVDEWPLSPVD